MDSIRQWALTVCVTALAGGMAQMLLPKGSIQKVFRIVLSVFFLCAMILPFSSCHGPGRSGPNPVSGSSGAASHPGMEETVLRETKRQICRRLEEGLSRRGVKGAKIGLEMNTQDKSQIYISKLTVTLPGSLRPRQREISAYLKEEAGIQPQLLFDGA